MKVYRIHISAWTASFRYPNLISGYQPTLPAPPISTINGLISAAAGDYKVVKDEKMGFVLKYSGKTIDLETIYPWNVDGKLSLVVKGNQHISNVVKREFLTDVDLYLYTDSEKIASYFYQPKYPILLGRSGDLAQINKISEMVVAEKNHLSLVKGTIIPFRKYQIAAPIQALPVYFTNTIPRRNVGTQPYYLLDFHHSPYSLNALGFSDNEWDVYWQEI